MKDIYQLLNDVNLDEIEFEEMEVSALEKANVKRTLKKSIIIKNKQTKAWKMNIAAASILVGLSLTSFVTLPAYAGNIPVIEDIFRFFDHGTTGLSGADKEDFNESKDTQKKNIGLYYDYKKYSNEINITKESNGVKFTINDAVFDGKTATLTYTIESEQDIGNANFTLPRISGMYATGGTGITTKIDTNKYVGFLTVNNLEDEKFDVADIKWNIDSIKNPDNKTEIKGDWKFDFSVKATESKVQILSGITSEKNGVKVNVEKISITPMSFTLFYNQEVSELIQSTWDGVHVDLEIKDDLGNIYSGQENGGEGAEGTYNINWSKTFEKLDQKASKLIITPHVKSSHNSNAQAKPNTVKEEHKLDDIIIELVK
ncbi:DUF4179 domain-containing protein [Neobacillus novalis]|uniref:DUF4179 domain-containing protein n=1 Tax=Neobacillus novalis TaxID=220687 RepID=A0AA95SB68_9BACI|nr:DUF4179 domain-containing protein [Neobacillus novalis]WHY84673.1 DUF4179 domain-containing protein [Neobacillus novalis]